MEGKKVAFVFLAIAIAIAAVIPASADITKSYYSNEYGRWITSVIAVGEYNQVAGRTGVGNQVWGAKTGGLDLIYNDGTNWQVQNINSNTYTEIVNDGSLSGQMLAVRDGSVDLIYDQNGTWQTAQLSTNTYKEITTAGTQDGFYWGLRDNGDLDLIWYNQWGDLQWHIDNKANGNYTDITRDGILTDNRVYAAKAGGGLDILWYDGSWHQAALGTNNTVYDTVEFDGTVGGGIWAEGANGLDWIWYNPYAGGVWQTYPQSPADYQALTNDPYGVPNVIYRRVYAARADGGIDQIMYTGSWVVNSINMSIDGFDGRIWTSLDTDALDGGVFYGTMAAVPEPSAILSMLVGVVGMAGFASRRKK